jgi:hypothetical protein
VFGISQEWLAVVVSAVVLLAAVGVLFLMKRLLGSVDGSAFVAILLVPLIVYALVSGRLAEFSGPGGWGAKFRLAATSQVETSDIIENAEALQAVEKGGLRNLRDAVERLNPDLPNALTLRVGRRGYYAPGAIVQYLQTLMAVGPSTYVVFVGETNGQFLGSASASQVIALLESDATRGEFMSELERGNVETAFQGYDFLVRQSLSPGDSNKMALQKFLDTNAQALVVVSSDAKKPIGIVDRDRLMTRLMVNLAGDE